MYLERLQTAILGLAGGLGLSLSGAAFAFDGGVEIDLHRSRNDTVVVQPPPVVEKCWVPERVIRKEERVLVEPARIERRKEFAIIEPEHIEKRKETVLLSEAHTEKRWVPSERVDELRIGPVKLAHVEPGGHWERVDVPAQYQIVERAYVVPARYGTVVREVEVPARYETIAHNVVVPGHWEEVQVVPPRRVVEERHRDGLEIDLDLRRHGR